jgi:predicted metalloendopeptidase
MQYSGFNLPFQIIITNNIYDSKINNINIVNGEFSFNNKNIYLQKNKRKQFLLFLKNIFYEIFGKDHSFQIENILKVETEMSKYLYSSVEENDLENKLNFYSEENLHSSFQLDFSKIFHQIHLQNNKKVQVENPKYLKNISLMFLKKWNSSEWKEYWIYQIIKVYSSLDKNINDLFFKFFEVILEEKKKRFPIQLRCLTTINNYMNIYFNQLYLKHYKNEKEINYCLSLAEKIKEVFTQRLKDDFKVNSKINLNIYISFKIIKYNFLIHFKLLKWTYFIAKYL